MTDQELDDLFHEVGEKHHAAYAESDGVDPEWAQWYAAYLQTRLGDRLGRLMSRSELTYVLIAGDREAKSTPDPSQWPTIYSRLLRELASS